MTSDSSEEREFLLRSLTDLDRERAAGDVSDDDYTELRDGYTARAAAVILGRTPAASRPRSRRSIVITVVVTVTFAVVAGLVVSQMASTRLPGDTITGDIAESTNSLLAEARALQSTQPDEAVKRYVDVLKIDPDNIEALTYRGWILVQLGSANRLPDFITNGKASIDRAIELDPTYADARAFRGVVAFRFDNDAQSALTQFDAYFAIENRPVAFDSLVLGIDEEVHTALGLPPRSLTSTTTTTP